MKGGVAMEQTFASKGMLLLLEFFFNVHICYNILQIRKRILYIYIYIIRRHRFVGTIVAFYLFKIFTIYMYVCILFA